MIPYRNRAIFGEFDFAVDKFRPSSVSWSPSYGSIKQGIWVSDEDFISQVRQIKDFVEEPWRLADNSFTSCTQNEYHWFIARER